MLKFSTLTAALLFSAQAAIAQPWVVLDVRSHGYEDRLRIVLDLDRNLAVNQTLEYRSIQLQFDGELRRVNCSTPLPDGVSLGYTAQGVTLTWDSQRLVKSFQLTQPPRQVIDLYQRVGDERVPGAATRFADGRPCQHP